MGYESVDSKEDRMKKAYKIVLIVFIILNCLACTMFYKAAISQNFFGRAVVNFYAEIHPAIVLAAAISIFSVAQIIGKQKSIKVCGIVSLIFLAYNFYQIFSLSEYIKTLHDKPYVNDFFWFNIVTAVIIVVLMRISDPYSDKKKYNVSAIIVGVLLLIGISLIVNTNRPGIIMELENAHHRLIAVNITNIYTKGLFTRTAYAINISYFMISVSVMSVISLLGFKPNTSYVNPDKEPNDVM